MRYEQILDQSAVLLNDIAKDVYSYSVMLPYLNIARSELEEIFELNDIPTTHETSDTIVIPAGTTEIGYDTTPALPSDLVEIRQLWESVTTLEKFVPLGRVQSLSGYDNNVDRNSFIIFLEEGNVIKFLSSIVDIDIKIDYIKSLFTMLSLSQLSQQNSIRNTDLFFINRAAALASEFIEENTSRADSLSSKAAASLERSLGIKIKAKQVMPVRRRPFRAGFKLRRGLR